MSEDKDSPEVVEFLSLFAQAKRRCNSNPQHLGALIQSDDDVRKLCSELAFAHEMIFVAEDQEREKFSSPVNPLFIKALREYEARYAAVMPRLFESDPEPPLMTLWRQCDDDAAQGVQDLESLVYLSRSSGVSSRLSECFGRTLVDELDSGIEAWEYLTGTVGFDPRGAIRRRCLIRLALVPRSMASRFGNQAKYSLAKNLQQAHEAFIFGATLAALALMRSILEVVLRDFYKASGEKLDHMIRDAEERELLPGDLSFFDVRRLKRTADKVVHLDRKISPPLLDYDDEKLEREIARLFGVLHRLIEQAA